MTRLLVVALIVGLFAAPAEAAVMIRGPYLQSVSDAGAHVMAVFDVPVKAQLEYATGDGPWMAVDSPAQTDHRFEVSGLAPQTRYRYRLNIAEGDAALEPIAEGAPYYFVTHPVPGDTTAFRFLAWGDSGDLSPNQTRVASQLDALLPRPDFALILGDIVYPDGQWEGYDPAFFRPYQGLSRNMGIWPTIGNHDAKTEDGAPYLHYFHTPANNPQSNELYYSFDYGNAHFLCLDSQISLGDPEGAMLSWAIEDLAASDATWKLAFFHHPPYSAGTHGDNTTMIERVVPILEAAGVDMVMTGHSHVYERSYLVHEGAVLDMDPADYVKIPQGDEVTPGTLYVVSGNGGKSGELSGDHRLMAYKMGDTAGNSVIEIEGDVLRGFYVERDGARHDLFSVSKGPDTRAPKLRTVRAGDNPNELWLWFDEPLRWVGAAQDYTISGGIEVSGAELSDDHRGVLLTTSAHALGGDYEVTVAKAVDTATPQNTAEAQSAPYRFVIEGPPVLLEMTPPEGSRDAAADTVIEVVLGHVGSPVDTSSVYLSVQGQRIRPSFEVTPERTTMRHQPEVPFAPGELVALEIAAHSEAGLPLPATYTFFWVAVPPAPTPTPEASEPPATPPRSKGSSGCAAAGSAPTALLAIAALALLRRR